MRADLEGPWHPGLRVWFDRRCHGAPGLKQQLLNCVPQNGDSAHLFTATLGDRSWALPMSRNDWLRSNAWDREAQKLFEMRLARTRSSFTRSQCLRIKGSTLVGTGDRRLAEAGRELLRRVLVEHPDETLEVAGAHYGLAVSFVRDERFADAIGHLRICLELEANGNFRHETELLLAETLIAAAYTSSFDEAQELLSISEKEAVFGIQLWRIEVARSRLLGRRGDRAASGQHARRALELLANDAPAFSRHPTVGLIETDKATVREMQLLAKS